MGNQYPLWKYILIFVLIALGLLYAAPNLYGEDPAVQVSVKGGAAPVSAQATTLVRQVLVADKYPFKSIKQNGRNLLVRFFDTDTQLKAREAIKSVLGQQYVVAINLASRTPAWLEAIGAHPMKLGLDLRGGVHFLLNVDIDSLIQSRQNGDMRAMGDDLRKANIRYAGMLPVKPRGFVINFRNEKDFDQATDLLQRHNQDYLISRVVRHGKMQLNARLTQAAITRIENYAVEQTMSVLRNRINELGVAEPIVQQQGVDKVSVDLPGVQDTARAKEIIGKTATLRFHMVDTTHDPYAAAASGDIPLGTTLYYYEGRPYLLKNQVILRGSSITSAMAGFAEDGKPNVSLRLGGGGESLFSRVTAQNVGKPLAVVYVEFHGEKKIIAGKPVVIKKKTEKLINVANINEALGTSFQITGLGSTRYAQNLALLLRSGALMAPVTVIQELTIGPSLGKSNIEKGVLSLEIGSLVVIGFMVLYYRLFGLIANLALILNVVFILAILSILGATLTLPGIAGIVLTVGMAVDANVLINERIREELRNGMSIQASIKAGYERAFSTIVDANVTTLIVALVLFALGSGSVKGFAITLTIGLLTSMVTAIFFTRGIVNLIYGRRRIKRISIGIKTPQMGAS